MLNRLTDLIAAPLREWPAEVGCALATVAVSVLLMLAFKHLSNQPKIEAVKNRMTASVLGVWLYRDQPRMIARCQLAGIVHGFHYLGLSMAPLLIMALPMLAILAQMNAYYALAPVPVGARTIAVLAADASRRAANAPAAELTAPPGVRVEAVNFDRQKGEYAYRLACEQAGTHVLKFDMGGRTYEKSLAVGGGAIRVSPERFKGGGWNGFWGRYFYPSEPTLSADDPVSGIRVDYPARELWLFWRMDWILYVLLVMLVAVLALRGPMGVAI